MRIRWRIFIRRKLFPARRMGFLQNQIQPFLKSLQKRLGKKPEQCLVLEDSKYGIMAGRRAGAKTVFIPDVVQQDRELYPYIQNKVDSLLDVIPLLKNPKSIL
mgnify:CR=1 FL=1